MYLFVIIFDEMRKIIIMSFIEDVNAKLNAGFDITEFHLLYNANKEKFSKAYGKRFILALDPNSALKFWEETVNNTLGILNKISNDEDIESQFHSYKDYIYRHDYNTEPITSLWEIVNVLIAYAAYDPDNNKEDFCQVVLKKKDRVEVITYRNNKTEETLN